MVRNYVTFTTGPDGRDRTLSIYCPFALTTLGAERALKHPLRYSEHAPEPDAIVSRVESVLLMDWT